MGAATQARPLCTACGTEARTASASGLDRLSLQVFRSRCASFGECNNKAISLRCLAPLRHQCDTRNRATDQERPLEMKIPASRPAFDRWLLGLGGRFFQSRVLSVSHRTFQQSRVQNAATSPLKMASTQMAAIDVPEIAGAGFASSGN